MLIEQVDTMKYLGLYLDRHLDFSEHIENTIRKVGQRIRMLWKMRGFISQDLALYLYKSLIHPVITYGDFIYDGGLKLNLSSMQIAQNKALRAVRKCKPDYPNKRLHAELGVEMLDVSTAKMVFRGIHNQGPPELNNMINIYAPNRALRLETLNLLLPPKCKTSMGDTDIAVRGCLYWNQFEYNICTINDLENFKSTLKEYQPP